MHVGKADQYGAGTTGQWLDVTGVPNGSYFLEITVDGENVMQETNETNNTKNFPFTLNVNPPVGGITPDQYDHSRQQQLLCQRHRHGRHGHRRRIRPEHSLGPGLRLLPLRRQLHRHLHDDAQPGQRRREPVPLRRHADAGGFEQQQRRQRDDQLQLRRRRDLLPEAQLYNSTTSSNYQIGWNLLPLASSSSGVGVASEAGTAGSFVVARNGPTTGPLTVNFTISGTATNGVDYQSIGGSVVIGTLELTAVVDVIPIDDNFVEGRESVILTLPAAAPTWSAIPARP